MGAAARDGQKGISTHTLRKEGDDDAAEQYAKSAHISTHTLRKEGDE